MYYSDNKPWVTYLCIGICVLVFMLEGMGSYEGIINRFGVNSYAVHSGEWWRLITAGFVHGSISHIAGNCYCLYILGSEIEKSIGHGKFSIILLGAIIVGDLFVCWLSPGTTAIGISGGVYGLMLFIVVKSMLIYGNEATFRNPWVFSTLIANIGMNFLPGVAWQGHLGGSIVGIIMALILK